MFGANIILSIINFKKKGKVMKKKIFMSAALMLLLGGVSANAKAVNFDITTSCGAVHHVSEIGDNVSKKQFIQYVEYIDWVYCG